MFHVPKPTNLCGNADINDTVNMFGKLRCV